MKKKLCAKKERSEQYENKSKWRVQSAKTVWIEEQTSENCSDSNGETISKKGGVKNETMIDKTNVKDENDY